MSPVGRMPIDIPAGVNVNLDGQVITVKGAKGALTRTLHQDMKVTVADNVITVERPSDDKNHRALHGLTRALIANMVKGVTEGFKKEMEIVGVGYRAQMKGKKLALTLGFSHPLFRRTFGAGLFLSIVCNIPAVLIGGMTFFGLTSGGGFGGHIQG